MTRPAAPTDVAREAAASTAAEHLDLLRERLKDAEDTLRAIRLGETDALMVQGPDGPRVYTLVTADQSYRTLVEQMRQAALILSYDGTILYCNSRLTMLLGGPSVLARALPDLAVAEDRDAVLELVARAADTDAQAEFRLARHDGDAVSVHVSMSELRSGTFNGLAAIVTDLTEQKVREKAAERERLTDAVLDFAGTAILVCDAGGRVVRANQAALTLCGTEVIGRVFDEAIPVGVGYDELRAAAADAREVQLQSPDGATRAVLISVRRIGNGAPDDGWWVVTVVDLTERERLRLAEQRARERLQRLQEVTAGLSAAVSPDHVAQVMMGAGRSCVGATAALVALLTDDGRALDVVAAEGYPQGLLPRSRRLTLDAANAAAVALRTGEVTAYESEADRARRFGGDCAAALEAGIVAPLSVDGRSAGVLAFGYAAAHTWTEAELALAASLSHQCAQALDRAQLYASERAARAAAEEANRAKSDFLSVMSHELRTPLNSVLGYADLLLMQVNGSLSETQKLHIARIQVSARHQLALVEEILSYARLEAGSEHLRVAPVDVSQLMRDVEELMRPEAERRGITLHVDLPLDEELKVITDPGKLRQIALNLTANAMKFTREGGAVLAAGWDDDGWLLLRVEDTGPGIPPDLVDKIWQPFTQLDSSATREIDGAGLGLAIVRRLVEFMGGQISVDTEVGRGSTFTVRLPRKPPLSAPR